MVGVVAVLAFEGFSGCSRVEQRLVSAERDVATAQVAVGSPSRSLIPHDARQSGRVGSVKPLVSGVLDRSRWPQVYPAVIRAIAVDVVYAVWNFMAHKCESQSVQALILLVDHHDQIAVCGLGRRDRSRFRAPLIELPSEQPCVGVIDQQVFEVVLIFEHARPMPGHARAVEWLAGKLFGALLRPGQNIQHNALAEHAALAVIVDRVPGDAEANALGKFQFPKFVEHVLFDEFMRCHSGTHSFLAL